MPKSSSKPKPVPVKKPPRDPQRVAAVRRFFVHLTLFACFAGACAAGMFFMRRYVERKVVFPAKPPRVVLKDRPVWMSDVLAEQVLRTARPNGTHSTFDHKMLVNVTAALQANPWVREVRQVRRVYGEKPGDTLEIDCEFRAPIALVRWGDYYSLVDGEGTKLPEQFTGSQAPAIIMGHNRKVNIRIVDGVKRPPPEPGQKWLGEDVSAGLDLVKLLHGQPFAEEVLKVDVDNFEGRVDPREAQIVLGTKYGSEVRWGRAVNAKDFFIEVSTDQKLGYMKQVHEQFGRVDGNQPWIDIRFDKVTYPSPTHAGASMEPVQVR
ncbi:MAG: hypothetical protein ACREIT_12520 [Tepidisphaeraceae bacterium]